MTMFADFAVIPLDLHATVTDADNGTKSVALLPRNVQADFEFFGLGGSHGSRTITYFGSFRTPMLTPARLPSL